MKSVILYLSEYNGNTKKLATALADRMCCLAINVDKKKNLDLSVYDVIGLGSAIHFGSHHPRFQQVVETLELAEKNVFVFSTHGAPYTGHYHDRLRERLRVKGATIMGEFSTPGFDATGPFKLIKGVHKGRPNEKDIDKAFKYIRKMGLVESRFNPVKAGKAIKFGKYKDLQIFKYDHDEYYGTKVSVNHSLCNGCGKCIKSCPLHLYELTEFKKAVPVNELDCIQCGMCQDFCKQNAIFINGTWKDALRIAIRHKNRGQLQSSLLPMSDSRSVSGRCI
ncbi:MAG: 4Fe-4S binding protein [Deltaproteobacteria bacterium]|nr:4Fe-4S binding protein [Deltaproteobacteria bacterium]